MFLDGVKHPQGVIPNVRNMFDIILLPSCNAKQERMICINKYKTSKRTSSQKSEENNHKVQIVQ